MTSGAVALLKGGPLTPSEPEQADPRWPVAWKSYMTALLWAMQVTALMIAIVYWFVINANHDEASQRRLGDLQLDVSAQIAELRHTVATGLGDLLPQLDVLPDMRARTDLGERQVANLDARHNQIDTRMTTLEHQVVELHNEMGAITRASNVPLPGTRR
jgi:multidrug resistance efflux pump